MRARRWLFFRAGEPAHPVLKLRGTKRRAS